MDAKRKAGKCRPCTSKQITMEALKMNGKANGEARIQQLGIEVSTVASVVNTTLFA